MRENGRRRLVSVVIPAIVGLTSLLTVIGRPRFQTYHTVDVLELVASGMCFGVALVWMLMYFRKADG